MTETEQWEEVTRNMMESYKPGTGKTFGRKAALSPAPHVPAPETFRGYTEQGIQQMARIGYLAGGALLGFLLGVAAGVSGGGQ